MSGRGNSVAPNYLRISQDLLKYRHRATNSGQTEVSKGIGIHHIIVLEL